MKCPYCNSELIRVAPIASRCPNPDCPTMKQKMPNNIWQDLIDGKKAQGALKKARILYNALACETCELHGSWGVKMTPSEYMERFDKEITAITKQDTKE